MKIAEIGRSKCDGRPALADRPPTPRRRPVLEPAGGLVGLDLVRLELAGRVEVLDELLARRVAQLVLADAGARQADGAEPGEDRAGGGDDAGERDREDVLHEGDRGQAGEEPGLPAALLALQAVVLAAHPAVLADHLLEG